MKKGAQILNIIVPMILIMTLTFANIFLIGNNIAMAVYEELEEQTKTTSEKNIEFDAYFKNDKQESHSKQLNINSEETLYISVNVKDKVSISSAKISIENANFVIDKEKVKENQYIQNIDELNNTIEISTVSSNNNILLEVPIKFKKESQVNDDTFSKECKINISGTFKNSNLEEKDFSGSVKLRTMWTGDTQIELNQSIEKYFSLGENGLILQQKITTNVKDNTLPRKTETISFEVPVLDNQKPESTNVLVNGEKVEDSDKVYDTDNGIMQVTTASKQEKTNWSNSNNEYTIIYKYNKSVTDVARTIKLKAKSSTQLFAKVETIEQTNEQDLNIEKAGNVASVKTTMQGDLYKGYMYASSVREATYQEINNVEVSYLDGIDYLELNCNNDAYLNEQNQDIFSANNIKYISTTINKTEMTQILGDSGQILIQDENSNIIAIINKDTQTDENGNINTVYAQEYGAIIIKTSKPIKEGNITITNNKSLKGQNSYSANELKAIKKLQTTNTVLTNLSSEVSISELDMKESTTEAKLEVSRNSFSTMKTNKNVEIKATLKSNDMKYDLYKNATVEIQMPEDIKTVNVKSINILYGEGFTIKPILIQKDGKETIHIDLIRRTK